MLIPGDKCAEDTQLLSIQTPLHATTASQELSVPSLPGQQAATLPWSGMYVATASPILLLAGLRLSVHLKQYS